MKGTILYDTWKAITVRPYKFAYMSPVQAAVLPLLPQLTVPYDPENPPTLPRDLLVKAKTGTGKTLAFLVPAIDARIKAIEFSGKRAVREAGLETDKHLAGQARRKFSREHAGALIISPTRELATQIANDAIKLSTHHDDFGVQLFTGGSSKGAQMRNWMRSRKDIVIATPGRLRDLLQSEPSVAQSLAKVQTVRTFLSCPRFFTSSCMCAPSPAHFGRSRHLTRHGFPR